MNKLDMLDLNDLDLVEEKKKILMCFYSLTTGDTFQCYTGSSAEGISSGTLAPSGLFSLSHRTKMVSSNAGGEKSPNI